jgi:hypothetical protein
MLLEKERERLLAVLQSRTATHAERSQARRALEDDLTTTGVAEAASRLDELLKERLREQRESSAPTNGDRPAR